MINTEISTLGTAISDIKDEIIDKGQTVSPSDTVASLALKIDNISNKNGEDFSKSVLKDIIEGSIQNLYDKELLYIRPYCFTGCNELKQAWFTNLKKICRHAFDSCFQFSILILEGDFVILENENAFRHTLISNGNGKIYVSDSLLTKYKNPTLDDGRNNNWAKYSDYIFNLSDL